MIALAGKATSIRTRLYFATVFSLLLLVGVGLLGYVGLDRTRDTVAVLFKQHVQTLTDMSDLRTTRRKGHHSQFQQRRRSGFATRDLGQDVGFIAHAPGCGAHLEGR